MINSSLPLLDWLFSTQLFGYKLGLENIKKLLSQLKAYPRTGVKVLHVAGTNGKGSTCAMAESIARACGIRTGLFTSPHLIDFRERIRINGEMISPETLNQRLQEIQELVHTWEPHPTFFELTLALAMKHFYESGVELIILETGLGGRLDATNAVPKDVAVLTPIGLDHTQWLGNSLSLIGQEKADIIAPHKPIITAAQKPEVMNIIACLANERRAPLQEITSPLLGYRLSLEGAHQQENAALAVAALEALNIPMRTESVAWGLSHVKWEGRFELLGTEYILDGAHNTHALPTLLKTWRDKFSDATTPIVFSAVDDKDVSGILNLLSPLAESFHFAPMSSPRALSPEELVRRLPSQYTEQVFTYESLNEALAQASARRKEQKRIPPVLITGSLYLVGEVKALWDQIPIRPTNQ